MVGNSPDEEREQELERLYRSNFAPLFAYVVKLTLGDAAKAEDIVQDTMLRAWQHMDELGLTHETARPWLFTVARRIVIDQLRARAARPTEVHSDVLEFWPVADDAIERTLDAIEVYSALASLPVHHRDVLVYLYLRERTTEETAALMGIPKGTVKSRAHHALRTVRRTMTYDRAAGGDRCQASISCAPAASAVEAMNPA
ncbi:sigma-70 family RNA polymerase sigma factor [Micromonospora polyrhachis]|uniref:RNA polymerase sigma factor n=1 Tax=Micromonospora polyrhachis TaxID=1282883 RepID=A0A7W7SLE9_9ACTN|nr:sigma-70 family RNA polymerase sigma factor [Micromonospora polyrhachis]MBB4956935.1 RNA polymerase sigma-70 factor (ECF subfamily) [Micromonospora polyrhachis]